MSRRAKVANDLHLQVYKNTNSRRVLGETHYMKTPPQTGVQAPQNSKIIFKVGGQGTNRVLESLKWICQISRASVDGGNTCELMDFPACYIFEFIEFKQNGTVLERYNAETAKTLLEISSNEDEWDLVKIELGAAPLAERRTKLQSSQKLILNFSRFVDFMFSHGGAFPINRLQDEEFTIEIKLVNNFSSIIKTSGGNLTPFTIEDNYMLCEYVKIADSISGHLQNQKIIPLQHYEPTQTTRTLKTGSSFHRVTLSEFIDKKVVFFMFYIISKADDVDNKNKNNYIRLNSFELLSSGKELHNTNFKIEDDVYRLALLNDYNPPNKKHLISQNLYIVSYSHDLGTDMDYSKHSVLSGIPHGLREFKEQDVSLEITFDENLATDHTLYVQIFEYSPMFIKGKEIYP